ncbi:MAG: hypothetical protein DRH97_05300, partial [Chloroflexi bacterium]
MANILQKRPPMYQTSTPHVEFYIGGFDILRSKSGKPRRLVSFQHNVVVNGDGKWTMDVFDDDHTSIEELVIALRDRTLPELEGISNAAVFRYGYISKDGKVLSTTAQGDEYFVGTIETVRPSYQTNGAMVTLAGTSMAPSAPQYPADKKHFYGIGIYHIIKMVCHHMDWKFVPLVDNGKEELEPGEVPILLLDTQQATDSTEEQARSFHMGPNELPFAFIKRLCGQGRAGDPKYTGFACRLEYRSEVRDSDTGDGKSAVKPQGYLYFGPVDMLRKPTRKYVYMRDPTSDVLSFDPVVLLSVALVSGASGSVTLGQDSLRGELAVHEYTEVDRMMKYFGNRRPRFGREIPEDGTPQEGPPEEETDAPRYEGGTTGPSQTAPPTKRDPDAPDVEQSIPLNNRFFADQIYMDNWIASQLYCHSANLEVFGDPTLYVAANIAVFLLVPQEGKGFKLHWVSGV